MKKMTLWTAMTIASVMVATASEPLLLDGFAYGNAAAPDGNEWENCQTLAYNKEQPRAYFFPFASAEQASGVLPEHSPYYLNLDGKWKFSWASDPENRKTGFQAPGYPTEDWDDIDVPGCWNVLGITKDGTRKYGTPIYVNQPVPFFHVYRAGDWKEGVMRTPPEDWTTFKERNDVGSYVRNFSIPTDWKGREVYINFDGVDSFFYLWINGRYVGFSKNSRNTASFNITRFLNPKGDNKVAAEVYRYSDGSFLESQDMFRLPGIIRSVYLTSVPAIQIRDLAVRTTIPADADGLVANGRVNVQASLRNLSEKTVKNLSIRYDVYPVELYSDKTSPRCIAPVISGKSTLPSGASEQVKTEFTIPSARLWSAEQPNRYVLVAQLLDGKGKTIETVSTYFGVRQVEIRDTPADKDEFGLAGRYFYINNRPVKLKGVNRHESDPATGHSLSHERMEREVMLMKRANLNHVRNSHYNDDPYWYMLCDKYGIYLEDEANLESHEYYYGEASLSHPVEWKAAHVARNMEMVHSHVNHPSIVIWSLGNEAGPGQNFTEAYNAIKAFDTSRPVQYERNNDIVDMGSNQYPPITWVQSAVKGGADIKYPFHISEFAHSMGNALGGFADYWEAMESTNFFCGGAIWDWIDQAIYNYTPDGIRYLAYGGDFGDTPNDGMFCMNGIMFPDLTPKPQYSEVRRVLQYVGVTPVDMKRGKVEVFNKNYFIPLDYLRPRWILMCDGVEVACGEDVIRPRMTLAPRSSQTWTIPYDFSSLDPDSEYFVNLQFVFSEDRPWAKAGYIQAETQLKVKDANPAPRLTVSGKVSVTDSHDSITVSGKGWTVVFDNATGSIRNYTVGGRKYITEGNGPRLSAFRAPVDNDIWIADKWYAAGLDRLNHKAVGSEWSITADSTAVIRYVVESQAPCATVMNGKFTSGRFTLKPGEPLGPDDLKFVTVQTWTVYPDGSVGLQAQIDSNHADMVLPRIGYEMQLPDELSNYTYYGRGPENNYGDRKAGQDIGLYRSTVAAQYVNFPKPQSMGNRDDIRWDALTDDIGNGLIFIAVDSVMSASALPWSDRELTLAPHPHQLPASRGTTLHLDRKVTGLGGASCGQGGPLQEHRAMAGKQNFSFIMRPVSAGSDLRKMTRQYSFDNRCTH